MAMLMVGVYGGKDKLAEPILYATAALMVMLALYSGTQSLEPLTAFKRQPNLKDGFATIRQDADPCPLLPWCWSWANRLWSRRGF